MYKDSFASGELTAGPDMKLHRADGIGKSRLAAWFSALAKGLGVNRATATVLAYNDNQELVAQWTLMGVYPVRYTGPSFSVDNAKVATETIELAHTGFLG